jgi:endoglucanase
VKRIQRLKAGLLLGAALIAGSVEATGSLPYCATPWTGWSVFHGALLTDSGRVVDRSQPDHRTVSEAQAYALFFALVAHDPLRFESILRWTTNNLAQGALERHLPAWLWGLAADDQWTVIDPNPAADADLWLSYTLAQAGRLWQREDYRELGRRLAQQILDQETVPLGPKQRALLPGPKGFEIAPGRLRLNPSYLPLPLLRWLCGPEGFEGQQAAWRQVLDHALDLLDRSAPTGLAPEWVEQGPGAALRIDETPPDPLQRFNAIRVYLWLGLTSAQEPRRAALLQRYRPMLKRIHDADPASASAGRWAALLPFALAAGDQPLSTRLRERLTTLPAEPQAYYDQALTLFAFGFLDGRFAFDREGRLLTCWARP